MHETTTPVCRLQFASVCPGPSDCADIKSKWCACLPRGFQFHLPSDVVFSLCSIDFLNNLYCVSECLAHQEKRRPCILRRWEVKEVSCSAIDTCLPMWRELNNEVTSSFFGQSACSKREPMNNAQGGMRCDLQGLRSFASAECNAHRAV